MTPAGFTRFLTTIGLVLVVMAPPAVASSGEDTCGNDASGLPIVDPDSGLPVACGVTILRADEGGFVRVVIPEDVEFVNNDDIFTGAYGTWAIRVDDQHIAGFVLHREPSGAEPEAWTAAWRFPATFRDGEVFAHAMAYVDSWPGNGTIPAGTYRIQLFTERGVPAEVELRFGGLEGRVELSPPVAPFTPVSTLIRSVPLRAQSPVDESTFQGSESGTIDPPSVGQGAGVGFSYVAVRGWPQVTQSNVCLYVGGPKATELESLPVCVYDGGNEGSAGPVVGATYTPVYESHDFNRMGVSSLLLPGSHTFVASAESVGGAHTVEALAAWVSFG